MKIGLFGGAFDPIHVGHLSIIRGAIDAGLDLVIVIPSARAVFKRGHTISAAPYRYYMAEKGITSLPKKYEKKVILSDIEFRLPGISYTYNTVRKLITDNGLYELLEELDDEALLRRYCKEENSYYWLCGSDILGNFDKWYKPNELLSTVSLMTALRPGDELNFEKERKRIENLYSTEIVTFAIAGTEVSSSAVRLNHDYSLLPDKVIEFINTHDLYNKSQILNQVSETVVNEFYELSVSLFFILSKKRLLHTLNVALYSAELAAIHKVDANKALIAGVLHDCAKELPIEEQREYSYRLVGDLFENERLYHSAAGAYLAREQYGITDSEILNSILYHTTGHGGMTPLDSIVYIADKLEPSRTYADLEDIRRAAAVDLITAVKMVVGQVKDKFDSQQLDVHPLTYDMINDLDNN